MNETIEAVLIGIPYACIALAIVCVAILYCFVGAWLVSTNYKIVACLYFLLSAAIGFVFLSYMFGVGI